jgi:hypothetical protein
MYSGPAEVLTAVGQTAAAREHRLRADALYRPIGVPAHARA